MKRWSSAHQVELARVLHQRGHRRTPLRRRMSDRYRCRRFHHGIDLPAPVGTPVRAIWTGTVATVAERDIPGKFVILDHGNGWRSTYAHLSETPVVPGQTIVQGQRFARTGDTGRSTGPHLHFMVQYRGRSVNPALFFDVRAPQ